MLAKFPRSLKFGMKWGASLVAHAAKSITEDTRGLVALSFHAIVKDKSELFEGLIEPFQFTTAETLRHCIEYYQSCGYSFVSPTDLVGGDINGPSAILTFDDGYANNMRALEVLDEFNLPGVFFISTGHIESGHAFWWDVLYRERTKRGRPYKEIRTEIRQLKRLKYQDIEFHIQRNFGRQALMPLGEIDRPLTKNELHTFAAHRNVHIGNHTRDHAILTNYNLQEATKQIAEAQQYLTAFLGEKPVAIAYPNGNVTPEIADVAKEIGLEIGFTMSAHRTPLPLETTEQMCIGRFMPDGYENLSQALLAYRFETDRIRRLLC